MIEEYQIRVLPEVASSEQGIKRFLLEEKGVAVFPGEIFGSDYKNYIRLSYACSEETIRKALRLIKEYLDEVRA